MALFLNSFLGFLLWYLKLYNFLTLINQVFYNTLIGSDKIIINGVRGDKIFNKVFNRHSS